MKKYIYLFTIVLGFNLHAQNWISLNEDQNKDGLELNPLKGFMDLYGPTNNFPRSINGKLFGLNEVMFGLDNFDFTVINNFIDQNKNEGNFTHLQVNIDPGPDGNGVPQSYMPAFLDGQYDTYLYNGPVNDLVPDWNDPEIIEAILNFIAAFGAEYNDREEVFFINLGLYGIYGEWQIGDAANPEHVPEFAMTLENRALIANAYKAAFPNKYLTARYPEPMPDPEQFGYSDGLYFAQSTSTNTFFNHFYFDNTINLYNAGENWKSQIIGGEIDPCIQPILWQNYPNVTSFACPDPNNPSGNTIDIQNVEDVIDQTHPSFLISHHIFTNIATDDLNNDTDEWSNAIRAQKRMGYTFYIDKYRLSVSNDGFPSIEVNIKNTGVAPLYANWDIEFAVLDSNNQLQILNPTDSKKWGLNLILPGEPNNYRSFKSPTALLDGETYTFLLRVKNPIATDTNNAQPVRFANTTQDIDLTGWLTLGQKTITFNSNEVIPIEVTGVNITPLNSTLTVGDNLQLNASISPSNASNQNITWVSDKPGTASVDANGLVTTGPNYGTVNIRAYAQGGNFEDITNPTYFAETTLNVEPISTTIPATIEAEDYIRMSGVVVGFGKLGFIDSLDWKDYSVNVSSTGNFFIDFLASCAPTQIGRPDVPGEIRILDENGNILDTVTITQTANYDTFQTYTSNSIALPAGSSILRFEAKVGNYDLDKIEFREDNTLNNKKFTKNQIKAYPNPTQNTVHINAKETIENIVVYNVLGQEILYKKVNYDSFDLDLSNQPDGNYFAKIMTKKSVHTLKLIKI